MKRSAWWCLSLLAGCFSPQGTLTDEMPDDLPAGQCADTDTDACVTSTGDGSSTSTGDTSSTSGEPLVDGCDASEACMGNGACVAPWNADEQARGPFECRFACVPLLDETTWCSDDASCCDAGARCTARGYCILDDARGTGTSSGGL